MVVDAVTFDFWNTLAYEPEGHLRGRRVDAMVGVLEDAGFAIERERLHAVLAESWDRYVRSWKANQQYLAVQAAEDIVGGLGFDLDDDVRGALTAAFTAAGDQADLRLTPGVAECLAELRAAGVRIGIVCDVGMTPSSVLRAHLDRLEVLSLFDHWSFSDEVGVYKPDPGIFEHALAGLGGVAPARVAHVGDLRRTDIAGARSMGMIAVRYTGIFDDTSQPEPEGHHVLADHRLLPAAIGVVTPG